MSFLAGRLAGTEGAFFAQQSKIAAARLREKLGDADSPSTSAAKKIGNYSESKADVLPEILSHSMPPYTYSGQDVSASSSLCMQSSLASVPSLSTRGKGGGGSDQLGGYHDPNVMNPLTAWVSLPRATFGPKRWTLPSEESSLQASTANELRQDLIASVDIEKMKAATEGFSTIGKAFAIATGIVFGGTILVGTILTAKLQLHTRDDIKREGKNVIQPKVDVIKERFMPVKTWGEKMSQKWQLDKKKHSTIATKFVQGLSTKGRDQ